MMQRLPNGWIRSGKWSEGVSSKHLRPRRNRRMITLWLFGLIRERKGRLAGTIAGIAITVALLASLGTFLAQSTSSMTRRAIVGVPVDWQVQLVPGTDIQSIAAAIEKVAAVSKLQTVGYSDV